MAYAAIKYSIIHPNQAGALTKLRSAIDIAVPLLYDVERALAAGKATQATESVHGCLRLDPSQPYDPLPAATGMA